MSSYPLPPSPGPYPPLYDRRTMRSQRKFLRAQQRATHDQLRAQRRSLRRGSIVGPLILLALGVVFLLAQMGTLSWSRSIQWYGRFWPAILIAAGIILLLEWAFDNARSPIGPGRVLGGGTVFLLIFLALAGLASRAIEYGLHWSDQANWSDRALGNGYTRWDHLFGDRHESGSAVSQPIAPNAALLIRNPHGDVTVSGSSSDGQVHVSVLAQAYAWKNSDAERKVRALQPTFTTSNGVLSLNVSAVDGGQADLTLQMPRSAPLTIEAGRGDVTVSEMGAPVTVSADSGDINLSGISQGVTVHSNDDEASITLHSIHGPVSLQGHSGDIDISEITGGLTLQGDFFGSTSLQHIRGPVRFTTSRTQFTAARLDDHFSVDKDSLDASALLGPVILRTEDKNITLDRVQGSVDLSNRNGSVDLTAAAPLDAISIQNQHGSVDLGLPPGAAFNVSARTRNGDMENDFGLNPSGSGDTHTLRGPVNGGGPTITITTTDDNVTLRRSTVAPLPRLAPDPSPFARVPTPAVPPKTDHHPLHLPPQPDSSQSVTY